MTDVFISYKREDRATAKRLATQLRDLGFSVWWDFELLSGQQFRRVIEEVIEQCSCTIVLWSHRSRDSQFVLDEAAFAQEHTALCPARIDDCRLPIGFGVHTVDLRGWDGDRHHDGFRELLRAVEEHTGKRVPAGGLQNGEEDAHLREVQAFKAIQAAVNESALSAFIKDYPSGPFSDFVRAQLAQLESAKTAASHGEGSHGPPRREPTVITPPPLQPAVDGSSRNPRRNQWGVTLLLAAVIPVTLIVFSQLWDNSGPSVAPGPQPPAAAISEEILNYGAVRALSISNVRLRQSNERTDSSDLTLSMTMTNSGARPLSYRLRLHFGPWDSGCAAAHKGLIEPVQERVLDGRLAANESEDVEIKADAVAYGPYECSGVLEYAALQDFQQHAAAVADFVRWQ